MNFPEKNSRGFKILKAFHERGAMTIYQGEEAHGNFPTLLVPRGVSHRMVELYVDMVERGCLDREGILYKLSDNARRHLDKLNQPQTPGQIVPPRVKHFLAKPNFMGFSPFTPRVISL